MFYYTKLRRNTVYRRHVLFLVVCCCMVVLVTSFAAPQKNFMARRLNFKMNKLVFTIFGL